MNQFGGQATFGGTQSLCVPFGRISIFGADKGGFTPHGEAHIALDQLSFYMLTQGQYGFPLIVRVGLGDSGRFVNSGDVHLMAKRHLCFVHQAFNGRRTGRLWRAGQRDVTLTCQQTRGGVKPNPSCAWQVDFAPCMQVGKVNVGAAGTV